MVFARKKQYDTIGPFTNSSSIEEKDFVVNSSVRDRRMSSLLNMGSCDVSQLKETGTTSTFGAIFIVMNAALGAAMLNMPYSFYQAGGIPVSLIVEAIFVAFAYGGLLILGFCAEFDRAGIYQEVMRSMGGKALENFTEITILLYAFTSCISYMVLAADQGEEILQLIIGYDDYNDHSYLYRKIVVLFMATCFILPMCLPKDVSFLQYPSIICFIACMYVTVLIFISSFSPISGITINTAPSSALAVLNVVPTIAFGFQCHVSSVPVYAGLKSRTMKNWSFITFFSVVLCTIVYSIVGACGYLTFGNLVTGDILDSFNTKSVTAIIARCVIGISICMTYPVIHFCGRASIESLYRKIVGMDEETGRRTWAARYYIETFGWFILAVVGAMFVPSINTIIKPIGAFAALFIVGLPGFSLASAADRMKSEISIGVYYAMNIAGCIAMVIAAFLFGQSFTSGLYAIFG